MKVFLGNETMDLRLSLIGSAQCFSWLETPNGFIGAPGGLPVRLWRDECGLWAEADDGLNEADVRHRLRHYLDLNRDYAAIAAEFAAWPVGRRAMELYPGLRVLNQPAWEALVAFILSANNNVMRIRRLVLALNREYGAHLSVSGAQVYVFPSPERLAACAPEELCALVDAFSNPLVGCCWDTGHGMISGNDQYEALTLLGHRVKALHIDDNYGTARDVHLLPYEGLIDWSKVLRALREIGYDHDFAFEHALNPTPHAVMPAQLRYMCALGREMLSNM